MSRKNEIKKEKNFLRPTSAPNLKKLEKNPQVRTIKNQKAYNKVSK